MKLKPLGPPFEVEVEAVLCPLTGAEQGVVMSPCWLVGQSWTLHGLYLWYRVGQRNGRSNEECAGGVLDESYFQ